MATASEPSARRLASTWSRRWREWTPPGPPGSALVLSATDRFTARSLARSLATVDEQARGGRPAQHLPLTVARTHASRCALRRPAPAAGDVIDTEHRDRRESDEQSAHARRVHFHRGSPELDCLRQRQVRRAPVSRRGPLHPAHLRRATFPWASTTQASCVELCTMAAASRAAARRAGVQCGTSSGDDEVIDHSSPGSSSPTTALNACHAGEGRAGATVGLWG